MTPRIKVTGYIDTDDIHGEMIDVDNPTGLSDEGFDSFTSGKDGNLAIAELDDLSFELEEDEDDEDSLAEFSDRVEEAHNQ
jgi:hypothetical protein